MPDRAVPEALLHLANLGRPRRPGGAVTSQAEPILPDATVAAAQLAVVVDHPIAAKDLTDLRRLQRAVAELAGCLVAGTAPGCAEINALVADTAARLEMVVTDRVPRPRLIWSDPSVTSALARRVVEEVGGLEPDRLRQCARPECDLLFYDTTRSRTRRWHAEDPCGWRERQRLRRSS